LVIAIPASIISDTPHLREKTAKVGLIGRTAAIFRVDEIVVYRDNPKENQNADLDLVSALLSYMETPQYLRKRLHHLGQFVYRTLLPLHDGKDLEGREDTGITFNEKEDFSKFESRTYVEAIAAVTGRWLERDENVFVWTEHGFTKVKKLIRHKLHNNKKLFRINTHTGIVDVTEDHSLVHANGSEIKPTDVNEVIMGNVVSAGLNQNVARQAAINAGIPYEVVLFMWIWSVDHLLKQ
jgi:hypothetical protein